MIIFGEKLHELTVENDTQGPSIAGDMGTKTIQLQEGDDSKTAIIGAGLGDK